MSNAGPAGRLDETANVQASAGVLRFSTVRTSMLAVSSDKPMPAIASLLYGIRTIDPDVFLAAPLILVMVSFAASYIPARRATNVRPIVALREG